MSCTIMPCLIAVKQRKVIKQKKMRTNSRFYRTYQTHSTEGLDKPDKTEKPTTLVCVLWLRYIEWVFRLLYAVWPCVP